MYIPKLAGSVIPAIWKLEDMPFGARAVLTYFVLHMDRRGENMRPGVELCAKELNCHTRTVIRWLKWLVANKFLISTGKFGYTDSYRLNLTLLGIVLVEESPAQNGNRGNIPKKVTLKKPPISDEEDDFEHDSPEKTGQENGHAPENSMRRGMDKLKQRIGSYWRLKQIKSPDAFAIEPEKEELAAFLREYRAMQGRLEDTRAYELEANYAELILREKGVLVR